MNKAEAISVVVSRATFWKNEDLRTVGSLVELEDADTVTCNDPQALEAWKTLGNRFFIECFNKIYMEGQSLFFR